MSEYIYGSIGDPLANVLGEIYLPRVEVVRCRDCKHFEYCQFHRHSENKPNGFCAWGERRDA